MFFSSGSSPLLRNLNIGSEWYICYLPSLDFVRACAWVSANIGFPMGTLVELAWHLVAKRCKCILHILDLAISTIEKCINVSEPLTDQCWLLICCLVVTRVFKTFDFLNFNSNLMKWILYKCVSMTAFSYDSDLLMAFPSVLPLISYELCRQFLGSVSCFI